MLQLFVLYACTHFIAGKHTAQAGKTQCVQREAFFSADQCRKKVPKPGRVLEHSKYARSWVECEQTRAQSWIPIDADAIGNRLYQATASVSDQHALTALLAPLPPRARAALRPSGFQGSFERAFQGPGDLSYFIVGTGSSVIAFAVTHLDDFQFAQMDADVSSAAADISSEGLDFKSIAEDAGVELSYRTVMSQRRMPPPGGMEVAP